MIPSDYQCDGQLNILDFINRPFEITKPIRMIELFAGYGSQSQAMRNIGADYTPYKCVEFDKYAVASFNAIHGTDFPTMDIKEIHGKDLEIVDRDKYCYILFYSFPCTDISVAGQMRGFEQGSETRSALLWEVQRILDELLATNSNSQCYKQFGNSIVVPVLMAIFSQLRIKNVPVWNELTEDERENLIVSKTIDWRENAEER